jgi:bacteriorhodopsin
MPDLSVGQYQLVYNLLSLTIAAFFASFVFYVLTRNDIAPRYRGSIIASALVVFIAGYHYVRIFGSWEAAYALDPVLQIYRATGIPFNDGYRYVDWLLTVPLLLVELVIVLSLAKKDTGLLLAKMIIASVLMIGLGYLGEIDRTSSSVFSNRGFWGLLSSIPFAYILFVLLKEIRASMARSKPEIAVLLRNAGLLTLFTWGFYPIAFMAPFFGLSGSNAEVFLQSGYSIADIAAKAGYGLIIYNIARLRTEELQKGSV